MPKIQNVGVGGYIRDPRGSRLEDSRGSAVKVLKVFSNQGNSFTCYYVTGCKVGPNGKEAVLDTSRYQQIPIDSEVEQVTI